MQKINERERITARLKELEDIAAKTTDETLKYWLRKNWLFEHRKLKRLPLDITQEIP